jgi:branched-chain amino acid aminotransferase
MSNKRFIFFNGKFVPWEKAKVSVATHALNYGTGCFEGIRAYWSESQKKLFVFRLSDHIKRMKRSAKTLFLKLPVSEKEFQKIVVALLRKNKLKEDAYIRPLLFKSEEVIGKFDLKKLEDSFAIFTVPLGRYLNTGSGVKTIISSWRRIDARTVPPFAKPTGIYLNTALAKTEALARGVDEAILLNLDSSVAEGSAENIFLVKNKKLITPSLDQNILAGITRKTIIELAKKELGIATAERKIMKKELFLADEVFLTGTGAEVAPVIEIDGKKISQGKTGKITSRLQFLYFQIVHGENKKYRYWLTGI